MSSSDSTSAGLQLLVGVADSGSIVPAASSSVDDFGQIFDSVALTWDDGTGGHNDPSHQ